MESIPIHSLVPIPFISLFTSLLLAAGLFYSGFLLARIFFSHDPDLGAIFGITLIFLGSLNTVIFAAEYFHFSILPVMRVTGIVIMSTGAIGIVRFMIHTDYKYLKRFLSIKILPFFSKITAILLLFLCASWLLLSLSPLTDIDSLDYHVGFPVVHLFYGYHLPLFDWFHTRLFGIGESFNILGLATWTDHLSSVIQFFGLITLIIVIVTYLKKIKASSETILVSIIILSSTPVLLHMISSQKSELLGNLAVLFALSGCVLNEKVSRRHLFLSVGALFFALGIKYSFYVTGFFPWVFIGYIAWKNKLLKHFVFYSLLFYILFLFPFHLFNLLNYGNPVSPLFAGLFNEVGSKDLGAFEKYLREFNYSGYKFPLNLLVPASPGSLSTTLGLGLFMFLFLDYKKRITIELVILALCTFLVTVFFVQRTSRFFLDSYYVILLAYITNPFQNKGFSVFRKLLAVQTAVVTVSAVFGVFLLFPGSLTQQQREKTLETTSNNYSLMKYLDKILPEKSYMISDFRDNVYNPRPFIGVNYPFMIKYYPSEFISRINNQENSECYYIANRPLDKSNILYEAVFPKEPCYVPLKFPLATRNPFNKKRLSYEVYIFRIDADKIKSVAKRFLSAR